MRAADIAATPATNLYDAIARLRPRWLTSRAGPTLRGTDPVVVYVDHQRFGLVDDLRSIPTDHVDAVTFWTANEATQRFGTGVAGGVIEVVTKR